MKRYTSNKTINKGINISVVPKAKQGDEIVFNIIKEQDKKYLGKTVSHIKVSSNVLTNSVLIVREKVEGYRTISTLISKHFNYLLNTKRYEDIVSDIVRNVGYVLNENGKWIANKDCDNCIYGLSYEVVGNCILIDERIGMKSLKNILKLFNIELVVESEGSKITSVKAILN